MQLEREGEKHPQCGEVSPDLTVRPSANAIKRQTNPNVDIARVQK